MTAPAATLLRTAAVPSDAATIAELERRIATLEHDLASARVRNRTLRNSLEKLLDDAPEVVTDVVLVDGMVTAFLSNGRIEQRTPRAQYSTTDTRFFHEWVNLPPVPGTAAAIILDALAEDAPETAHVGMSVVAG